MISVVERVARGEITNKDQAMNFLMIDGYSLSRDTAIEYMKILVGAKYISMDSDGKLELGVRGVAECAGPAQAGAGKDSGVARGSAR